MPTRRLSDRDRERRALQIFEDALDCAAVERNARIEAACGSDAEMRDRVAQLLSAHANAAVALEPLDGPPPEAMDAGVEPSPLDSYVRLRPEFVRLLEAGVADDAQRAGAETAREAPTRSAALLEKLTRLHGRYQRTEEVARGGMGVIYRLWDDVLERSLAMKVMRGGDSEAGPPGTDELATPVELHRFLAEAKVTAQLDHPGVVPLHDLGLDSHGRLYFTMRLVQGLDLGAVLKLAHEGREGWSRTRAVGVLVRVCETLAYAHSKGVLHRDLKPQNVMVGRYGETYVMDWGLAKVIGDRDANDLRPRPETPGGERKEGGLEMDDEPIVTLHGVVLGTPAFMPPEQAEGNASGLDHRADIYSAGAMLYMLLGGHAPYCSPGKSSAPRRVLERLRRGPPPSLLKLAPTTPAELVAICEKAMAREPPARYESMEKLAEDLRAYLENRVVRAHQVGAVAELRKWVARNRATARAIAAVLATLVAGLVVSLVLLERVSGERQAKDSALTQKSAALTQAEAMRLCAQSAAILPSDPGQALLMAIEAARREPGRRADTAILAALDALHEARTLIGHIDEITGVAFSPDGRRLISGARDSSVRVWDIESGQELHRLWCLTGGVNGVACDRQGRWVASFDWGGYVRLWDLATGKLQHSNPLKHPGVVDGVVFAPDGGSLLTTCRDGNARLWNVETAKLKTTLAGHGPGAVVGVAFFPDGERVLTAGEDGVARIWTAHGGTLTHELSGHDAPLASAEPSADGSRVVTAATDNTARLWDAVTGKQLAVLDGHRQWLRLAKFAPDDRWILTAAIDGEARLWDGASGKLARVLSGHDRAIHSASFSADSSRVLTASEDRTARIWDVASGSVLRVLRGHQSEILSAAFSPDGRWVLTGSRDRTARLWDADTADEQSRLSRPSWDRWAAFGPDRSRVVVFGKGRIAEIMDAATGELRTTLAGHAQGIQAAAFSPDGVHVATASQDRTARLWDAATGRELGTATGHEARVACVAFHPDGSLIATGSDDFTAALWEVPSGRLRHRLRTHHHWVNAVAFSPDGRTLASAADEPVVALWDVASGALIKRLDHPSGWLRGVVFSPDGRWLLVASLMNVIFIWDAHTQELVARLVGHDVDFVDGVFTSTGDRLATLHVDGSAHVWDVARGEPLVAVRSAGVLFRAAGFDASGGTLWTEAANGTRRSWPLAPLAAALASSPRQPTLYDWARIAPGSVAENSARQLALIEASLAVLVRVGVASWNNDPFHREGLFQHALEAHGFFADAMRLGPGARSILPDLVEASLGLMERAAELPRPPGNVIAALDDARRLCLPALPTYGAVDAALRERDREALVGPGGTWRLFRGIREPARDPDWMQLEHDDAAWEDASFPVGDAHDDVKTTLADRQGRYTSVYVRRRFQLDVPAAWSSFVLRVRHGAGFVAYLNGVEVYREAAGGSGTPLPHDAVSSRRGGVRPDVTTLPVAVAFFRQGENVLALQALAGASPTAGIFIDAQLHGLRIHDARRDHELLAASRPAPNAFARARRYLEARLDERAGRAGAAASKLRTLLDEDPGSLEVQARLAACLRASGQQADAAALLRRAVEDGLDFPDQDAARLEPAARSILRLPDRELAEYLLAARWALRAQRLESFLEPRSMAWSGAGFYRLGLHEEALERLQRARSIYHLTLGGKEYAAVVSFLAMTLFRRGQVEQAREVLQVLSDPERSDPWSGSPHVLEAARLLGIALDAR